MQLVLGYLSALLIGILLGVVGAGGAMVSVPALTYLFHLEAGVATTYSLFIIGTTALMGTLLQYKQQHIHWLSLLYFGIPSVLSIFLTRRFVLAWLPDILFQSGDFVLSKNAFILLLFATFMLTAAYFMIRPKQWKAAEEMRKGQLVMSALGVGLLSGLVGVGGGFLIIPALVILAGLNMKQAIGTSLFIVSLNSFVGFAGGRSIIGDETHWDILLYFTLLSVLGLVAGNQIAKRLSTQQLKPLFGYVMLLMGMLILVKESGLLGR